MMDAVHLYQEYQLESDCLHKHTGAFPSPTGFCAFVRGKSEFKRFQLY